MRLSEDTLQRHAIEAPERRKAALAGLRVVRTAGFINCDRCYRRAAYLCLDEGTYGDTACPDHAHAGTCCAPIVNSEATHAR